MTNSDPARVASGIRKDLAAAKQLRAKELKAIHKRWSRHLSDAPAEFVLEVATIVQRDLGQRYLACALIRSHDAALALMNEERLLAFGVGINSWGAVDSFAGLLAGPAWMQGQVPDALIHRWARSDDRWWRRAALVCTVVLNTPSHGGKGDIPRTFDICKLLVDDRDDMVVKAMSWALRKASVVDPEAVRLFLSDYRDRLAARVIREVTNKLETGLKNPSKGRGKAG